MVREYTDLSEREKVILRQIVHQFILSANPVGSRNLSRSSELGLSPASIRNIMSDLEDSGYLGHPHTSAGRVPTDKGYRFYVDSLLTTSVFDIQDKDLINKELEATVSETDELFRITSILLSDITNQLACVTYPRLDTGILEKIQIVPLSSSRILIVINIKSGLVKTIALELKKEVKESHLEAVQRILNEKLSGLTFSEIRKTFAERIKDINAEYSPIVRVFIDSADKIFTDVLKNDRAFISGTKNIIKHPEFEKVDQFHSIIELIEDKDVIVHILADNENIKDKILIKIGSENQNEILTEYSLVTKEYKIGDVTGAIGIVGPKRMEYSKIIGAVMYVAEALTEHLKKGNFQ
ncbi:MAG TPA: heat-inducible transcriptional repressor HrcA [Ignavibacteriales bacterium]|nr:heat-inducible transcriptional repressor HrcA [Ignavibacteriales bacterium]